MLESVSCNLCRSKKAFFLSKVLISPIREVSTLVKCRNCGLVYVNPRHPVKVEKEFYASAYHEAQKPEVWKEDRLPFFKKSIKKINSYARSGDRALSAPGREKLLDIGCGMGFFLDLARKSGWEVKGVDISDSAVAYGREKLGLDIFKGELKEGKFADRSFEVITSWNVLDQYYDPLGLAQETARLLKPDGMAFFRISNVHFHFPLHLIFKIVRKFFSGGQKLTEPTVFHIYMFSPRTVKKLLKQVGFKKVIVRNSPFTPVVDDVKRLVGKPLNRYVGLFLFVFIQIVFYLSLKRLILGPSLFVVARKHE